MTDDVLATAGALVLRCVRATGVARRARAREVRPWVGARMPLCVGGRMRVVCHEHMHGVRRALRRASLPRPPAC